MIQQLMIHLRLPVKRLIRFNLLILSIIFVVMCATPSFAVPTSNGIVFPVMGPRISGVFGSRKHPKLRYVRHHNGIDLAAPEGSAIRAIKEGHVVFADSYAGYGNLVVILHTDGKTTHYGHLSFIKAKTGASISAGEIIGVVGSTGLSTGPHLHFEVRENGKPLDPVKLFPGLVATPKG